ncbi:mediator of RNA polymerase II transcription subunit 15a [Gossypium arboreum]|uniref:mediator of RNA polymerase II transcription subunit 15a n=1 Tax=Gossypium arboreum TaxID=29729 RepID=UPI0022F1638F|nr:mediator of RNA polymerase II transcription subunit 15a [Gossypium arboreum]
MSQNESELTQLQPHHHQEKQETSATSSTDSTARTGHENGGDWQEEVYQKIRAMKETYFSELYEIQQKIAAKLLQVEVGILSRNQPSKSNRIQLHEPLPPCISKLNMERTSLHFRKL